MNTEHFFDRKCPHCNEYVERGELRECERCNVHLCGRCCPQLVLLRRENTCNKCVEEMLDDGSLCERVKEERPDCYGDCLEAMRIRKENNEQD